MCAAHQCFPVGPYYPDEMTLPEVLGRGAAQPKRAPMRARESDAAARWQAAVAEWSQRIFHALEYMARRKLLVAVTMAVLPLGIRLAALRAIPIPQPTVHDEFSYLLAADTFRSGRLTNPTHPMWQHFETFHELMRPTYQSKYPPAQGMILALGWKLLGHPWYGVWISFGLMCGCLCWMLQGWLPPVYALLGTLAAMGQIGIFGYWMDSYWGGAVAAAGGALVLGALPRLVRRGSLAVSAAGTLGVVLLANSRPYEGFVMVAGAAAALVWWRRARQMPRPLSGLFGWRNVVPFLLIGGCCAVWMAYYDYRVTGSPWKIPYAAYYENYALVPQWYILPPNPHPPELRHAVMRKFWADLEVPLYWKTRHNPAFVVVKLSTDTLPFFCSTLTFFGIAAALLLSRSIKVRLAAAIGAVLCCGVLAETWGLPHYLAGGTGLVFVLGMYGARMLRVKTGRLGPAFVLLFAATPFVNGLANAVVAYRIFAKPPLRTIAARSMLARGEKHLAIVQYDAGHEVNSEWVFNAADIDAAPIVWARDMGEAKNQELLDYYRDRKVWLVHADAPVTVTPYSHLSAK